MPAEHTFFDETARRAVADAVAAVEAETAAEIVVAVRHGAGRYRHVDYLFGALCALAMLALLLLHPRPFAVRTMPLDVVVTFALAALASARSPTLRRLLSSRAWRDAELRRTAREAFVDLGVSRTRGRTGVLVLVALLERDVAIVSDIGVDERKLGRPWEDALAKMRAALAIAPDLDAFLAGLRALGPALAPSLPRARDDDNELPDAMSLG